MQLSEKKCVPCEGCARRWFGTGGEFLREVLAGRSVKIMAPE